MKPLLVVRILTYNHENYIRQCLESVVSQKTTFTFKVIIGEDCSTDRTPAICKEYLDKYPDLIELHCNDINNLKFNSEKNWNFCINSQAKYIALLEGDDYWTDPFKLQKQVDFLEKNNSFTGVHSKVNYVDKSNKKIGLSNRIGKNIIKPWYSESKLFVTENASYEQLVIRNAIHTPSFLFKKEVLYNENGKPYWEISPDFNDIYIFLITSLKGNIFYFNEVQASYRMGTGVMLKYSRMTQMKERLIMLDFFLKLKLSKTQSVATTIAIQNTCALLYYYSIKSFNSCALYYLKRYLNSSINLIQLLGFVEVVKNGITINRNILRGLLWFIINTFSFGKLKSNVFD
jgi:glycosyltransferase involved in cell wall biosynthesis